jgi:putative selenium metabolism hydrolase
MHRPPALMESEIRQVVDLTCELIRLPSVLGGEEACARRLLSAFRELGYDDVGMDQAGNVWGVIEGSASGPVLLLDGHLDTVGVEPMEQWQTPPWSGVVRGGRILGRGASDMKGAVAAMAVGIAGLKRTRLRGRVVVCGSVGEETTEGTALRPVLDRFRPDAVIIGEATSLAVAIGGRGRAEYGLHVEGRAAHASSPDLGVSAVVLMAEVVRRIQRLIPSSHPLAGPAQWCVTDIISAPFPAQSMVPFRCRATLERRMLPGETRETVEGELEQVLRRAGVREYRFELNRVVYRTWTGVELRAEKWYPPWLLDPGHRLVRAAAKGLQEAEMSFRTTAYRFCTNAAETAGVRGIPTIGFGPSTEEQAHVVDEWVAIEQLAGAAAGYRAIAARFLAGS